MAPQPTVTVSSRELAYRKKHFQDYEDIKEKELICASCGNKVKPQCDKVFSHPILNTLHCQECSEEYHQLGFISSDEDLEECCRLCCNKRGLVQCSNAGKDPCSAFFCKKCIKRNAEECLEDIEQDNWDCFICNPKPIWKQRAICATVMNALPKKHRKKTFLRSDYLPSQKRRLAQVKKTQKCLQALCDEESGNSSGSTRQSLLSSLLTLQSKVNEETSNKRKKNMKNVPNKLKKLDPSEISLLSTSSSDDDTDEKELRAKHKNRNKNKACRLQSSDESSEENVLSQKSKKPRRDSNSSSEESSASSIVKRKKPLRVQKENLEKNLKRKTKPVRQKRALDSESSNDECQQELTKKDKAKTQDSGTDENSSEINKHKQKLKGSRHINISNHNKSSLLQKNGSESSSSKDFQPSKLLPSSSKHLLSSKKVSVKHSKPETPTKTKQQSSLSTKQESSLSTKQQSSLSAKQQFKHKVIEILEEFKNIYKISEENVENLIEKCSKKDFSDPDDADYIVLKSNSIIDQMKISIDKNQKSLEEFSSTWREDCQEQDTVKKSTIKKVVSSKTTDDELNDKTVITQKKTDKKKCEVSDCDSDEIFSDNEPDESENKEKQPCASSTVLNDNGLNESLTDIFESSNENDNIDETVDKTVNDTTINEKETISTENTNKMTNKVGCKTVRKVLSTKKNKSPEKEITSCNNETSRKTNDDVQDKKLIDDSIESKTSDHEISGHLELSTNKEKNDEDDTATIDSGKDTVKLTEIDNLSNNSIQDENTDAVISTANKEKLSKLALLNSDSDLTDDQLNVTESLEASKIVGQTEELNKEKDNKSGRESRSSIETVIIPAIKTPATLSDNGAKASKKDNPEGKKRSTRSSLSDELSDILENDEATKKEDSNLNSDNSTSDKEIHSDKEKDKNSTDSEERNAKVALLMSSNSECSTSDQGSKTQSTGTTSPVITSQSKQSGNRDSGLSVASRVKRRRINLNKNVYYMADEKLRMTCRVELQRLPQKIVDLYKQAIKSSRRHQLHKAIKSLIRLDDLERKRKKYSNSNSSDEDDFLKSKRRKKKEDKAKDSLMNHLDNVKNGNVLETIDEIPTNDQENPKAKICLALSNENLALEADKAAKDLLLNSDSDLEQDDDNESNESKTEENISKKEVKNKKAKSEAKDKKEKDSTDDKEEEQRSNKSRWTRNKLLTMKFSDSDTESEYEKWKKKEDAKAQKEENENKSSSDNEKKAAKTKKRTRRRVFDSDSDVKITDCNLDSDSSVVITDASESTKKEKTKKKLKRAKNSSDSDSSAFQEKKSKPKRRRIKNVASDSDSDDSDNAKENSQSTPGKSGRKNIRKVLKDKQVTEDTKQAAKEEEERVKRIAERQKLYNEMYEQRLAGEEKVEKLVLDFDPETKEELVTVNKNLVKRLKPHQAKGVKFMWDACFESLERIKTAKGSGCILAHCMGLGKTLQIITLSHTLLTHEGSGIKTIMVVCPLSTVLNWVNEFYTWLKDVDDDEIEIYEMTKTKKNFERKYHLEQWKRTGGVLIIGYDMFRTLTSANKNVRKSLKESFHQCLVDPGPDLVVCDEGHLLKNEDTALSKSMNRIKTLRRIVLTGTPLQNNLKEYHCMVQFVKPNLLGTKKEFVNRFVNPITNGQFDDSTEYDVKLMKKRAHVLHKMLEGSVQRFDYSVLTPFLPPKQEYVISLKLTEVQLQLYQHFLDNFARQHKGVGGSLFADFQGLQRIWTHPLVLKLNAEKAEMKERNRSSSESEGSLKDFIDDDSTSDSGSDGSNSNNESDSDSVQSFHSNKTSNAPKRRTRNNSVHEPTPEPPPQKSSEWWSQFLKPEHFEDMRESSKLVILFAILKASEQIGDKVLVFSQSLYSLTLIEDFLNRIDEQTQNGEPSEKLCGHTGSWTFGVDYFRLDGQTSSENRKAWCDSFNNPKNMRGRLFLISTRAGGLGINLTAANRVIIFDASWNPSHDVQSIFRIYRFGQKKPCYVYRFLAAGTMEEKIYNRQVTKLSLSCRVVDEQQIERHYSNNDLNSLYKLEPYVDAAQKPTLMLPKDRLLANTFQEHGQLVENCHEHDSLLENKADEELDEEERKQAWLEYEEEKKGKPHMMVPLPTMQTNDALWYQCMVNPDMNLLSQQFNAANYEKFQQLIRKDYPNATPEQQQTIASQAFTHMYDYWERNAVVPQQRKPMSMMQQNANLSSNMNLNNFQYAPRSQLQTPLQSQLATQLQAQLQQTQLHKQLQSLLNRNQTQGNSAHVNVSNGAPQDNDVTLIPSTSTTGLPRQPGPSNPNQVQEK